MKQIRLMILALAIILFTACGGSNSEEQIPTQTSVTLEDELKGKEFFVIEDSIQTKNMYLMSFDENLSSWNIKVYDGDYSQDPVNELNNSIAVTENSLTNNGGLVYKLDDANNEYINLIATTSDLVSLKMFDTADEAQQYYNTSLIEKLQAKEFFVVQNDLAKRTLFKITIDENATQWDIISYESTYNEENITSTSAGINIDVSDSFKLVAYGNSLVTLDFFEKSEDALAYYNSLDLRAELSDKTFYAVSNNTQEKQLIQFVFDEALSSWTYEIFVNDYNETASSSGTNTIVVTEDKIYETEGDTLKVVEKNDDYIEVQSLTNSLSTYRLYNTSQAAQSYYIQ